MKATNGEPPKRAVIWRKSEPGGIIGLHDGRRLEIEDKTTRNRQHTFAGRGGGFLPRLRLELCFIAALLVVAQAVLDQGVFIRLSTARGDPAAPLNLTPPSISGEAEVGEVLTASPGSWTGSPTITYQWERCTALLFGPPPNPPTRLECSAIEDGLANTYTIARKDSGYRLRVSVSASNAGVKSEPAESNDSEPVGLHLRPQMSAFAAVMPRRLPRDGQASAILRLGFTSGASNSTATPRLSSLSFELSRNIELHTAGLSRCPIRALYAPAAVARRKCAAAIVGHGIVRSELFFGHEYEPVTGKLTAYYFSEAGKPRIFARVQTEGATTVVYVLPFLINRTHGSLATQLTIPEMSHIHGIVLHPEYSFPYEYSHISSLSLALSRSFAHERRRSFLTASCPARQGTEVARFRLLRAELDYAGSNYENRTIRQLTKNVTISCHASG